MLKLARLCEFWFENVTSGLLVSLDWLSVADQPSGGNMEKLLVVSL